MHVREVNPVVNLTSLHSLECKFPHWHNSKLATNSLKFLAQVGNQTQVSRERLNLTWIKHRDHWSAHLGFIHSGLSAQKHTLGSVDIIRDLSKKFPNRARITAGAWTHDLLVALASKYRSLYSLRHRSCPSAPPVLPSCAPVHKLFLAKVTSTHVLRYTAGRMWRFFPCSGVTLRREYLLYLSLTMEYISNFSTGHLSIFHTF